MLPQDFKPSRFHLLIHLLRPKRMRGHPYLSMASPSLRGEKFFTSWLRWTARSRSKSGPIRVRRSPHIAPPWPTLTPVLDCPAGTLELLSEKTNAHSNLIMSVAFSPDGTKIVSGSADKTIKVWDSGAPSPQNCASFWPKLTPAGLSAGALELLSTKTKAHRNCVNSVAFSPDGTKIVSGANDGTIKVWEMVKWSRKDHLMFNITTQRFVLRLLWLNKYSMKFPDDVLDLLIEACLQRR